jgi:hypothetical protein
MYTLIHNGTVNTFNTPYLLNLAVMGFMFDNPNLEALKCEHSKTTILQPKEMTIVELYHDLNTQDSINKCSNMLGIDSILWGVVADYCQIRNLGLQKIAYRDRGGDLDKWDNIVKLRLANYHATKRDLMKQLICFIPQRFINTIMYQDLIKSLN